MKLKKIFLQAALLGALGALAGCGGGGGSAPSFATGTLKLGISGSIPAGSAITGGQVTLTLPQGVTIATGTNGAVAANVVAFTGPATGRLQLVGAEYSATPPTLKVGFYNNEQQGYGDTGEFATITYTYPTGSPVLPAAFAATGDFYGFGSVKIVQLTPVVLP